MLLCIWSGELFIKAHWIAYPIHCDRTLPISLCWKAMLNEFNFVLKHKTSKWIKVPQRFIDTRLNTHGLDTRLCVFVLTSAAVNYRKEAAFDAFGFFLGFLEMVIGHFAERHFADSHFADRHFADRTFTTSTVSCMRMLARLTTPTVSCALLHFKLLKVSCIIMRAAPTVSFILLNAASKVPLEFFKLLCQKYIYDSPW